MVDGYRVNLLTTHGGAVDYSILEPVGLRSRYATLTDALIHRLEGHDGWVPDYVVCLDRSGRPVAWLVRALWQVLARTPGTDFATGDVPPLPAFRFVNIDRETVTVSLDGTLGQVNRPILLGRLVGKAAALRNVGDNPSRHLEDLLTLAALLTAKDLQAPLGRRDREHLTHAIDELNRQGLLAGASVPQTRGLRLVDVALNR